MELDIYLTLFGIKIWRYLQQKYISLKSGIIYIFSHYIGKIKVASYDSLRIEKTLTLHNVLILIESVLKKDKNFYYYKIFLEKFVSIK